MADKKDESCEKFSLRHIATKRLYTDVSPSESDDNLLQSSLGQEQDNISFATKKFKYRDPKTESLDADSLKLALGSPVLSDSLDSMAWLSSFSNQSSSPSSSRNAVSSLPSLELNSIIQKCDMTTLNSLNMSQMSQMSATFDDATSGSHPQTEDMASPTTSRNVSIASPEQHSPIKNVTMNSISWSQTSMMSICEDAMTSPIPQTIEMASFSSQTSSVAEEENPNTCVFEGRFTAGLFNTQSSSGSSTEVKHTMNSSSVMNICSSYNDKVDCKEQSAISVSVTKCDKEESPDTAPTPNNGICKESIHTEKTTVQEQKEIQEENEKNFKLGDQDSNNDNKKAFDQSSVGKPAKDSDCVTNVRHESNSELKDNFKTCEKNPGHEKFYSPKDLKVSNLPEDIQHEDSLTFFQCLSKLVVQISVGSTSSSRSKEDVYSSYIGTNKTRYGSGFYVSKDNHMIKMRCTKKDCPHNVKEDESLNCSDISVCDKSLNDSSSSPVSKYGSSSSKTNTNSPGKLKRTKRHFIYGGISVRTNRHVIFDKSEADNATVNFFFHSSDRKEVVTGHVASILGVNSQQDHIILHVMSHNKLLLDMVDLHLKNAKSSYTQMIKSTHNTQQNHGLGKLSWVSVISHPHGTASSISFGRLKKEEVQTIRVIKYYDAATCPGSSGGLVVTPTLLHLQWPGAVHSSFCKLTRYNVSLDSRCQEFDATVIGRMNKNIINKRESSPENHFRL